MKNLIVLILFAVLVLVVGCGTTSKLYTFDKDGKAVLMEDVNADIIGSVVQSTKNKSLIVWHTGWAFGVTASPGTMEDPTPTVKIICGKFNDGYIAMLRDQQGFAWIDVAKAISATNSNLSASATGVSESAK